MSSAPVAGRRNPLLATLAAIMILADGALVAICVLILHGWRNGNLTTQEAATWLLLGASSAVGAVVMLLATIALARGPRGHGTARLASGLGWTRFLAVFVALAVIAIRLGIAAIAGSFQTFGAVTAVVTAAFTLIVTGVAVRRTTHPSAP
jgi:hypothetical protein